MAKKKVSRKTPKNPNSRQRKYVAGLIRGKSKQQAKREANYAESTKGKDIERKPAVQSLFRQLLVNAGATDEKLAQRMAEGLDAKKFGRIDYRERRESSALLAKVKGHLVEKHEHRITLEEILESSHE